MCISLSIQPIQPVNGRVVFSPLFPRLEKVPLDKIPKGDITSRDLRNISILNASGMGIEDVQDLAYFQGLDISGNPVSDIRELCYLKELYELTVDPSALKNENPIRWLKYLYNLEPDSLGESGLWFVQI